MKKGSLFEEQTYKNTIFGIILLFILCNFSISSVLYVYHISAQRDALFTEISNKSRAIGISVKNILEQAVNLGISLDEIPGTKKYLENKLNQSPELEYLVLTNPRGYIIAKTDQVRSSLKGALIRFTESVNSVNDNPEPFKVYSNYNIPLLIKSNDKILGYLHVGLSSKIIKNNISSIFYDILVIMLASLVIGYEFLSYFFMNSIVHPLREFIKGLERVSNKDFSQVNQIKMLDVFSDLLNHVNLLIVDLNRQFKSLVLRYTYLKTSNNYHDIVSDKIKEVSVHYKWAKNKPCEIPVPPVVSNLRLLVFLLIFAEAIVIPLLPSYAAQFYEPTFFCSKQFVSALPVLIFMIFTLITIPVSTMLSYKYGFKKIFILGFLIVSLGYLMVIIRESLGFLLVSRAITAIGFSLTYICFQNYVAAYASKELKLRSYAIFSVALGSAYICGAPLGGLLVDNIGLKYTFLLAIISAMSAILITRRYIFDLPANTLAEVRKVTKKPWQLITIPDLSLLVICSGLPMRMMHSALICFLYPLYLQYLGNTQSGVGRSMMVFGIAMFLISPSAPRFVKLSVSPFLAVLISFVMGISMMMDHFFNTTGGVILGLGIYAIGSVIHISATMSILESTYEKLYREHTQSAILGFYFIFERIGMIFGPILTSILLANFSYSKTLFYMGAMVLILNSIYGAYLLFDYSKSRKTVGNN